MKDDDILGNVRRMMQTVSMPPSEFDTKPGEHLAISPALYGSLFKSELFDSVSPAKDSIPTSLLGISFVCDPSVPPDTIQIKHAGQVVRVISL